MRCIGQPVARNEDARFLTGAGAMPRILYLVRQAHAVFVFSPHAHARIRAIDVMRGGGISSGISKIAIGCRRRHRRSSSAWLMPAPARPV